MKLFSKKILPQKLSLPKSLSKMNYNFNPILYNRFILYFISILALFDMIYFLNNDIISFFTFILTGFLTSFFSKNMIVILVIALCITHVLKYGSSAYISEGLENIGDDTDLGNDSESKNDSKNSSSSGSKNDSKNSSNSGSKNDSKNSSSSGSKNDSKNSSSSGSGSTSVDKSNKIEYADLKKEYEDFEVIQDKIYKNLADIEPSLQKAEEFITKFESYKEGMKKK